MVPLTKSTHDLYTSKLIGTTPRRLNLLLQEHQLNTYKPKQALDRLIRLSVYVYILLSVYAGVDVDTQPNSTC